MIEGNLGELVAGEHPMLGHQTTQLPVSIGESTSEVGDVEGKAIGAYPSRTTSGGRHCTTASESGTPVSAWKRL
jgi:hypothetical protein